MTDDELKVRHSELHKALDELLACFLDQHYRIGQARALLNTPIREFLKWSHDQVDNPRCNEHKD